MRFCLRFTSMGIIHTARRNIKEELVQKLRAKLLEEHKRENKNATISIREDAQVDLILFFIWNLRVKLNLCLSSKNDKIAIKKMKNILPKSILHRLQIKSDVEHYQKNINLNSVTLCFQGFIVDQHNVMIPITAPVYSNPIYNLSKFE